MPCMMHNSQSGDTQASHPLAFVCSPGPECKDDGENTNELSKHAMAVLESDAANHGRDFVD